MNCQNCNPVCIDTVSSDCVVVAPIDGLSCLQVVENVTLQNIVEQTDGIIAPICQGLDTLTASVDLACLQGECTNIVLPYQLQHVGNNWIITFTFPSPDLYVQIKVFKGATILYYEAAVAGVVVPVIIPDINVDNTGIVCNIQVLSVTGNGIIEYFKAFTLNSINAIPGTYSTTLNCTNNQTLTAPINNMLQILVNQMCAMQAQINSLL